MTKYSSGDCKFFVKSIIKLLRLSHCEELLQNAIMLKIFREINSLASPLENVDFTEKLLIFYKNRNRVLYLVLFHTVVMLFIVFTKFVVLCNFTLPQLISRAKKKFLIQCNSLQLIHFVAWQSSNGLTVVFSCVVKSKLHF